LLANGIDFVKTNGNNASILLISDSDQAGAYQVANQLIQDLQEQMEATLPIHVADFQNQSWTWNHIGGRSYRGNEYFYSNLTRLTGGNFFRVYPNYSFSNILSSVFESLDGFISTIDIHTTMENGFCYGRYNFNLNNTTTYLKQPILQVGKFYGTFPFTINVSGIYQSNMFSQQFIIDESSAFYADSLSEEIWTGNYIQSLEAENQTNDIISEIIHHSLKQRILSYYTAFLCLEPQQGGKIMSNPWDESELISMIQMANNTEDADTLFQAYPNPFNSQTAIKIKLRSEIEMKDISFKIYNIMGQVVKIFNIEGIAPKREFEFIWDGTYQFGQVVSSGSYIFTMSTKTKKQSLKLLFMK